MTTLLPNVHCFFSKAPSGVTPDPADYDSLQVHLGCTKEISDFVLTLRNDDKKFSEGEDLEIPKGAQCIVELGYNANCPRLLTGYVTDVKFQNISSLDRYAIVTGQCKGERMLHRNFTKDYRQGGGTRADLLVKNLLGTYVPSLSYMRGGVDQIEQSTTFFTNLSYQSADVLETIKWIAKTADYNGAIGADFRIAPDGIFELFRVNNPARTSSVLLKDDMEFLEYDGGPTDRIKNYIMQKGAEFRTEPADSDYCESIDGWTATSPSTVTLSSSTPKVGTYRILANTNTPPLGGDWCFFRRAVSINPFTYKKVRFWFKTPHTVVTTTLREIRLVSSNGSYFYNQFADSPDENWAWLELALGRENEYDILKNPSGIWHIGYAAPGIYPSWNDIVAVDFYFTFSNPNEAWAVGIDGLHFANGRFISIQLNQDSINAYGQKDFEDTDEELYSDYECELRAKAILAVKAWPQKELAVRTSVCDYGTTPLVPADRIHIISDNENVDAYFHMDAVDYGADFKTETLELDVALGILKAQQTDYMYSLQRKLKSSARYKAGRLIP